MTTYHHSDVLTVEIEGSVATVWLDRPEARNAFALEFWEDLPTIIGQLGDDPEIRAVVIAARGEAFTVGIDLKVFGGSLIGGAGLAEGSAAPRSDVDAKRALYASVKHLQRAITSVADCPKPVIAAIHGYCIGAGVDLITACDIRFAADDTVFSVRETKMAMVADVGTLQRLPEIINPGRVAEIVYTGEDFGADEAFEMGLISRIAGDASEVHQLACDVARAIAANSPLAVQGSKAVLRAGHGRTVKEGLDYVALWNAAFITSNDLIEAITAFHEKRPPEFTGT
ncbi:MAG: crotonase/enoyl-CoA hydratase family protein [Acidimicrobiia bacterium]